MTIIMMINRYLISLFSSCFLFHLMKIEISKNIKRKKEEELKYLMINETLIFYFHFQIDSFLKIKV